MVTATQLTIHPVFPRSSYPFYKVSYYMKWVTTSWTYSTPRNLYRDRWTTWRVQRSPTCSRITGKGSRKKGPSLVARPLRRGGGGKALMCWPPGMNFLFGASLFYFFLNYVKSENPSVLYFYVYCGIKQPVESILLRLLCINFR